MRIDISDQERFEKQVVGLRKMLVDQQHRGNTQAKVSANLAQAAFVPFLTALRAELRDQVQPQLVLTGVADLLAGIAKTAVMSMMDAPPDVIGKTVEQVLFEAANTACTAVVNEAERAKPNLSVVPKPNPGAKEPATVIHMQTKRGK